MTQQYPPPGQYGPSQQWQQPAPTPAAKKKRKWPLVVGGIVAFLFLASVIGGKGSVPAATTSSGGNTAASAPYTPPQIIKPSYAAVPGTIAPVGTPEPAADAAPPASSGPVTTFGNGTYIVGTDVAPGRYRSPAPDASAVPLCYWDLTDDNGKILDQGVANEGPSIATLKAGRTFKTSGCEDWTKVG